MKPQLERLIGKLISGSSRTSALSARTRIDSTVNKNRNNNIQKFTHFLAIPMIDKVIAENFDKFKRSVLDATGKIPKGARPEVFQKPEKMHLTLGMLVLPNDKDVKTANATLEECKEKIIMPFVKDHGLVKIETRGLGYFGDDLANIRVLYGLALSNENVLQDLAEKTVACFARKGLMREGNTDVKLHLTLMNASFAVDRRKCGWQSMEKIDASDLMKVHKDYDFGESVVKTVQICKLGPPAADGYYEITSKIDLTE